MIFHFHNLKKKNTETATADDSALKGILKIEVPHWSAQIEILNGSFEPAADVVKIEIDLKSPSGYSTKTELAPGTYQIKASLEGKTETEWVPVRANHLTQVTTNAWENLEFTSATPLKKIRNAHAAQVNAAKKMANKKTWENSQGDSGLFLFVRASNPGKHKKTFAAGLQLLDDKGNLITNFTENVEKSPRQGWLAFNADLPQGGYILRRGRKGVKIRNQAIYLCPGWQTEIFIQAVRYPSLGTMNVGMRSRLSFQQDGGLEADKAAEAAEAILNFLRYKTDIRTLLNSDQIRNLDSLIDNKFGNPWLGILAAYAILKLDQEFDRKSSKVTAEQKGEFQDYYSLLDNKVLPFLQNAIPTHPDVRALLIDKMSGDLAFPFPPMLWLSLKRIQDYSTRYTAIIPKDCLTDCVIEKPLVDSPWTAWNYLNRYPASFAEQETEAKNAARKSINITNQKSEETPVLTPLAYARGASDFRPQFQSSEPLSYTSDQNALQHSSIVQTAKSVVRNYVESGKIEEVPEINQLNSFEQIKNMLGQVNAEQISAICNIPLSHAESGLEDLKKQGEALGSSGRGQANDAGASAFPESAISETPLGQLIIDLAFRPTSRQEATKPPTDAKPRVKIENLVSQIRASAERLWAIAHKPKDLPSQSSYGQTSKTDEDVPLTDVEIEFAEQTASRLKKLSDTLLSHADFVVVTDSQNKIFEKNDAFLFLLLPQFPGPSSSDELVGGLSDTQAKWETALASLALGNSEIRDPSGETPNRTFLVRRALIEDKQANSQAHLNIIHRKNIRPIENNNLKEISLKLSDLTMFTSLFAYGTAASRIEYRKELKGIVARLVSLAKT